MSTDEAVLDDLQDRWLAAAGEGQLLLFAELCRDRPDLLPALEHRLGAVLEFHKLVDGDATTTTYAPAELETRDPPLEPGGRPSTTPAAGRLPQPGDSFGDFNIVSELGRGGMGVVYRARDRHLNRTVAIKVILPSVAARGENRKWFVREARALAAIQHDHVVPIWHVGEEAGTPFLVMPLLAGESLAARLEREGALPESEVRRIGREVAAGLAAIHAKTMVHRDLKPGNIWLEAGSGRVKVLDLGLAADPLTLAGSGAGTRAYMSPEQVAGGELDSRSDLFSLGSVLYECATGRRAFRGDTTADFRRAICEDAPTPITRANPAVSLHLARLVHQLHRKDPAERPASATAVGLALADWQPNAIPDRSAPHDRRRGWWLGGIAIVAGLVLVGVLWNRGTPPRGTTKLPPPAPPKDTTNESLRITAFDIEHFALTPDGKNTEPRGRFGDKTYSARQYDYVKLRLLLSRPAYAYLLAFRPDGVIDLCYPNDEASGPPFSETAVYPFVTDDVRKGVRYQLAEGPGLWSFAAVVSEHELPPFAEWKKKHRLPSMNGTSGKSGAILVDNGQDIDELTPLGLDSATRGKGVIPPGRTEFAEIGNALNLDPSSIFRVVGITAVRAK
jgi:serine/threonine protein kinase